MPSFPSIDLTRLDLSKLELPSFDLAKFDLAKIELAGVDVAKIADTVRDTARDAAYIAIGAGLLAAREVNIAGRSVVSATLRQARSLVGSAA